MIIKNLKFANCPCWCPELLAELVYNGENKFTHDKEFSTTYYKFSDKFKFCTITNRNKDKGSEMEPLVVEVEMIEFG